MVERAKPVMRAIKLTPPRPSARASSATNRRRLCSFNTGAICRYRLRAARACAARIMHPSYVARFLAVNPPHAFLRRLWQHRLSCLWTGPNLSRESRYAIPFFMAPNTRYLMEAIPSCVPAGETPKHPPLRYEEYRLWFMRSNYQNRVGDAAAARLGT